MKTSSCKAKGRKLQQRVRDAIIYTFPVLDGTDVHSRSMGAQGSDVHFSNHASHFMKNFRIECKNVEKINIWSAMEQAKENAIKENGRPCVVFSRNREPEPLVCITLSDFLSLLKV